MRNGSLQQFHGARIEVELDILGSPRLIRGSGAYDPCNPDLGPVLRILVNDSSGDFELLFAESEWTRWTVEVSRRPGCDYRFSPTSVLAPGGASL